METKNFEIKDFLNALNLNKENIKIRNKFLKEFYKKGFPTKKNEDWKFIDLNNSISSKIPNLKFFNKLIKSEVSKINFAEDIPINLKNKNFVISKNGFIIEINLNQENQDEFEIIRTSDEVKVNSNDTLNLLNKALYLDYIKLVVKKNYNFKKPIVFVNLSSSNIDSTNINQRFDIVMEKNSCLSLLDLNLNQSRNNFINVNNHFTLKEGSVLKNYKLDISINKNLYYSKTNIDLFKNSIAENFVFSSGSELAKNEIECNLKEDYSSAFVNGIIDINDVKQHEIRSKINHLSENTKSYQLIKCALKDNSKAVYQGKIFVDSVAQKTDGYQLSKAILLNEGTEFNGKPELEIYADDVKCSHGSSSGNLDENKIFYLMTRGLNKYEAKKILLDGFFLEVIEKITDEEIKNIVKDFSKIK